MDKDIKSILSALVDESRIKSNELMKNHTSFRVGGAADFFLEVKGEKEAADIVRLLLVQSIPFYIVGNGSNLLVGDLGYRGLVLKLGGGMSNIIVEGNTIMAESGCLLSKVANVALNNSLSGFEFAAGIPGSVGGAMVMNAGAYGGQMEDIVKEVRLLDEESGEIVTLSAKEMEFAYRSSIVKKHPYLVLSVVFMLEKSDPKLISEKMSELAVKRREKQPLEYPSAGSTFKRPEGYFAGKIIEDSGLKGFQIGGAAVSDKHCGFIINKDKAKASDIKKLIDEVQAKVMDGFGVKLEPEVCFLGDFGEI